MPHPEIVVAAADLEWEALRSSRAVAARPSAGDVAGIDAARRSTVARADRLRDFYLANPRHVKAAEARALEALMLLEAWSLGDETESKRREQKVFEVRRNPAVPIAMRLEVAAWADHLAVGRQSGLSRSDRLHAYEKTIRRLMGEFPGRLEGYEALLRLAKDSTDDRAVSIARELVTAPVPASWQAEAQLVLDRNELIGQTLEAVAARAGKDAAIWVAQPAQPVVLYTWAASHPGSLQLAQRVKDKVASGTKVIGINLDAGAAGGKDTALIEQLPGEQIHSGESSTALALALKLSEPALVYLADANGIIRSVSAHNDLNAAFETVLSR